MERQMGHLEMVGPPAIPRLPPRGLQRDVDLSEEDRPSRVPKLGGIGKWEGEDIGGPVGLEKVAVQGPQGLVARQDERDLGVRPSQENERLEKEGPKSGRS